MSRRFVGIALAAAMVLGASSPALAASPAKKSASHVVFNKSSKLGSLYVAQGLLPSHVYSIKVSSKGHIQFSTSGFQDFVYVSGKRAVEDSRALALKGKTPYSYTLKQPVSHTLRQWMMVVTVNLMAKTQLTVKVVDLGKA